MVDEESGSFIYYFMEFGAFIRGYAHMRNVITIDGTHLSGKYEGVSLSAVAQDTQNHIYPVPYCVVDKENDASWVFFFNKLKAFVVNEPELCIISDRHHGDEYGTSIYNYSSQIYSKESYLFAYLESICAASLELEWSVAQEYYEIQVLPPDFDPKLGRRKVKRVKVSQSSQTFKSSYIFLCGNPVVLKTSRTDKNSGKKFYSCAVGKWIYSGFEVSKFQGIAKFEMFERLRDSEENMDLIMTLYRESEHKIDHLKRLLKDVVIERDQLKHKLAMAEEKEKGMKFMVYGLLLVLDF
ncbi:hypothetical protein T459_31322 [Capsicum annuum]|uniref:MULE transposase domain-containing protein n=1 Tax=Capsicum annuum TaxID=4072 RepID=A0A2G2YAX4_CAPAN|nr:hypothetical protein T459_31322 [Capsicum annuum]